MGASSVFGVTSGVFVCLSALGMNVAIEIHIKVITKTTDIEF
ncbi:uncharacterized protein METZ01_LOCUS353695 [marine metagenome]|uniref:Uncharacterized protein n=1 Tax=marine metagenome TaxID=408172 RepID=A0A382RW05_9ZZZZ|tara:strand:- start:476 stop:601 length:126 start_codon:yes stop_codon:yes gene_type:complete